jgi:RNA polymerase sigma factor (TIGR02999 family)
MAERITALLTALNNGNREALDALAPVVYDTLRRMARARLRGERRGHTLDSGALVNEAFLELSGLERVEWKGRAHFFAIAARLMRNVLVDHAQRRAAKKRSPAPGRSAELTLGAAGWPSAADVLALDQALARLAALDERQAQVVECRFFAGMTVEETAAALEVSPATVKRDWESARAWLNRELGS